MAECSLLTHCPIQSRHEKGKSPDPGALRRQPVEGVPSRPGGAQKAGGGGSPFPTRGRSGGRRWRESLPDPGALRRQAVEGVPSRPGGAPEAGGEGSHFPARRQVASAGESRSGFIRREAQASARVSLAARAEAPLWPSVGGPGPGRRRWTEWYSRSCDKGKSPSSGQPYRSGHLSTAGLVTGVLVSWGSSWYCPQLSPVIAS